MLGTPMKCNGPGVMGEVNKLMNSIIYDMLVVSNETCLTTRHNINTASFDEKAK